MSAERGRMSYVEMYEDLRDAGFSEREAAEMVDLAVCEDALAKRLERPPTTTEVEREYARM